MASSIRHRLAWRRKIPGSVTSVFSEPDDFQAALRGDGYLACWSLVAARSARG